MMKFQVVASIVALGFISIACEPIGEPSISGNGGGGGAIVIGGGAAGSSGSSGVNSSAPMAPPVVSGVSPMIDDPEAEHEEWTEEVWADSEAHAMRKCQAMAEGATNKGSVTVVVGRPQVVLNPKVDRNGNVSRSGRYVCRLKSEK